MKRSPAIKPATIVVATLATLFVGLGCSGDDRPFIEAVEVHELGLQRLAVRVPAGSELPLVIGVAELIDLDLAAFGASGVALELDDTDRDWSVADTGVASITRDGVLTGLADGSTEVSVSIGGILNEPFAIAVSSAPLTGIQRIVGPAGVDPCQPARFNAYGSYAVGNPRRLSAVDWRVEPPGAATLIDGALASSGEDAAPGSIVLVIDGRDDVQLIAGVAGVTPLSSTVSVAQTLSAIAIPGGDTRALRVDGTLDLTASGSYLRDGVTTELDVTGSVEWRVLDGATAASVSNASPTRGRVTGLAAGNATVQASCGEVRDSVVIGVNDTNTGTDSGLVFQRGSAISISPNASLQLQVSTGSSYAVARDVTDDAGTTFSSDAAGIVSVVTNGTNAGLVTAIGSVGQSANVFVRRNGFSAFTTVTIR